ncbi:hypothetical protein ACFPRL_32285 [Pseudoclavibacter helvolus]
MAVGGVLGAVGEAGPAVVGCCRSSFALGPVDAGGTSASSVSEGWGDGEGATAVGAAVGAAVPVGGVVAVCCGD